MKNDEEERSSQNSLEKTTTSSFNDDTYIQEVKNPFFPNIKANTGGKILTNSMPGRKTVYLPSKKIDESKKNHLKFFFFGKSKKNEVEKVENIKNDNIDNNNINSNNDNNDIINNNKIFATKKLNKKLVKKNTINYSPADEFQKTSLEKNNLIEEFTLETNFGITLKPLEEQWKYQKILLDYNILDFTSK